MKKAIRILCILLMLSMILSAVPSTAFATTSGIPFTDVKEGDWFYEAVQYVYDHNMMNGTGPTEFSPEDTTTRGMIVTILHRLENTPDATGTEFTDVASNKYYAKAIAWASANNIVNGYGNGTFGPDDPITREQMATIMFRYTIFKGLDKKATGDCSSFADGARVSNYAVEAMNWAIGVGLIAGVGKNNLAPSGNATRAQSATILMRFCKNIAQPSYVVTFVFNYSDEGNEAVEVKAGTVLSEPTTPIRSGYTFDGWYLDPDCTEKYDFSTPVTENLYLFACWKPEADNAEDKEDTIVTADDKYILTADANEIVAESNTQVNFYVNSTLTIPYFELYMNGISTGIYLYDDGDVTDHSDDIPLDGCYSGSYVINVAEEGDASFTAKATVGKTPIETDAYAIFVYYEFSDSELEEMESIDDSVRALIAAVDASVNSFATNDERTTARYNAVISYLNELESSGVISSLYGDQSSGFISFVYVSSGVSGGIMCKDDEQEIDAQAVPATPIGSISGYNKKSLTLDLDYITYKEKATILNYCSENDTDEYSRIYGYTSIANTLTNAGFEVDNKFSVTVNDFKNLQDYHYIMTDCHGSFYRIQTGLLKYEETPVICTKEEVNKKSRKQYSADLKKDRIAAVTTTDGNTSYWIRPSFFTYYYKDEPLNCSIFYLNCCKGAVDNDKALVNAILDAGAASVVAYSETVYTFYGIAMLKDITDSLLKGQTVNAAVTFAKIQNGNDDLIWGAQKGFDPLKTERAVCNVYGNGTSTVHNELLNGCFDSFFSVTSSKLVSWKSVGDARSIFKLAGLSAPSSPKMAIISSGFGSMGNETTSCIYQTVLIPEGAKSISFTYDIVSEEPMEFVGTEYNDLFSVDLLSMDGNVLDNIAFESVNSSTWYAIDGIDFPGGDNTTFHTRWKTITSNSIAKYNGQLIVVRFTVQDAGDSIYDTAALIDSVTIQ